MFLCHEQVTLLVRSFEYILHSHSNMATSELDFITTPASRGNLSQAELDTIARWNEQSEHDSSLPPTDGGKDAWLMLAAAFAVEFMVWGKYSGYYRDQRLPLAARAFAQYV